MIQSKKDYLLYLEADRIAMDIKRRKPRLFSDEAWKFVRILRKTEYLTNCKNICFRRMRLLCSRYLLHNLGMKSDFTIAINIFGPGLAIFHHGTIIVNDTVKVGRNCQLYNGTNIALNVEIGDNVFIGPGAKLLVGVKIADGIRIGANAVVTKDFLEPNVTITGVPAKIVSTKGSNNIKGFELAQNAVVQ
ncbi:serine O-acetyltransferase [Clostridium vincentii]|uniref:Serine acetyltransferase n=1 Tax=Clostridium vincentii TaxID=52704 RepID=A0A2T0BD40_9CLOT|nr:DapH/DapD/GlmU-related protein [Clostridium vincentii]PRR81753.1 Serine acetyltransferase [Clostridium vincentii]